ncbi:MAG TPA: hypothetical protein VF364_03130 [Candidatus Limnocylindria bacterium]
MTDQNFVIEVDDDAEGHLLRRGIVETDDTQWLEERLRRDSGKTSFKLKILDEADDTEGHGLRGGPVVRVSVDDDDDTEGHAIAIHFPSRTEADAFRRRLLVTGVLVGTVALGGATGAGLSAIQSDSGTGAAGTTQSQAYENYREAAANEGARQGAAAAADAQAYANYQEAAANEGARQGAGAAQGAEVAPAQTDPRSHLMAPIDGAQVGPLDAHEAPAFVSSAAATDADRDIGVMDGSNAAAATQVGPLDAHEAPAFQQSAQVGPLDAHEAPAFQSGAAADEGSSELNDIGGPTPK